MLENIEKARKMLSGDTEARIDIENLVDEEHEDLEFTLTRNMFEKWVKLQLRQFERFLQETF